MKIAPIFFTLSRHTPLGGFSILVHSIRHLILLVACVLVSSCSNKRPLRPASEQISDARIWFRQASVDLGKRIQTTSLTDGFAISSGRGQEVTGRAYRFRNGQWDPFASFPYSDFPQIIPRDTTTVWILHHLVHTGAYQPKLFTMTSGLRKEIPLPRIMWDAVDYVMWTGLSILPDGTAWMVGQQGYILFFDGTRWNEVKSPVMNPNRKIATEGDLNDMFMLSHTSGWAVGRDGVILRYESGAWKRFPSPTQNALYRISMANEQLGWSVGEKGTILRYDGSEWRRVAVDVRANLRSVKTHGPSRAWIVGDNSTLLVFDGERWVQEESIKIFDDALQDISVVIDSAGTLQLWIIGNDGIYTTSQALGFSFTDITGQASLRRLGKGAIFFDRRGNGYPDLLLLNEEGPNLLYENDGQAHFTDITGRAGLFNGPRDATAVAIGDVDNDGSLDIFQLLDQNAFRLHLGRWSGGFRDATEESGLTFPEIASGASARFVDFDNDRNLDLYISLQEDRDLLFKGDGTGRFTPVEPPLGVAERAEGKSRGAVYSDFNNDGMVDAFIPYFLSVEGKFFDLFLNKGNFSFEPSDQPVFYSQQDLSPYSAVAHDFNNDGSTDILVYCQKAPPVLFVNKGDGTFENVSASVGFDQIIFHPDPVSGILNAADINNDGWMDVFIGSRLFLNSPKFRFTEVSEQTGVVFVGNPSFADVDNDGDMDLFIGSSRLALGKGDRAALFRNNTKVNSWIKVRVSGDRSNRAAFGAKVFLQPDGKPATSTMMREIAMGSSPLLPQQISEAHFGAESNKTYQVRIQFPSGAERVINSVRPGTVVDVSESSFALRQIVLALESVERTGKLIRWSVEIPKLVVLCMLIVGFVLAGKRFGAGAFAHRWYFPASSVLLYGVLLHITITNGQTISSLASISGTILWNALAIAGARALQKKREATYVSHYKLMDQIGAGGMGRVFRAYDVNSKITVALKLLHPELLKDVENRRRLSSEGHLLSSFSHPHIVKVYEIAETQDRGFIAMEYLPGGTLKELLESSHPLSLPEIKRFLLQIAGGLTEIHRHGIVHRDLKTGNIMLDAEKNVRIMDFGLSKSPLVTTMTSLGTVLGTLGYVAPEQITNINLDHRSDIFSFGVVAYELLTNTLPFKGENEIALIHSIFNTLPPPPSSLRTDLLRQVDDVVMKCLAKDPSNRFQSVDEVRLAVERDFS